jgi:diaminohydroxyphosphoribosylaminopyrimidine deaminase/5-amino-6-(5-phosphoribosylamino)uracil reductase
VWRREVESRGAEVLVLPLDGDGHVDLRALVEGLGAREILSLLVEGGGVLHAGFFAAGLVDKVHAIIAPKIVGGTAYPAVAGDGAARMADAITLRDIDLQRLGDDAVITGYVVR